MKLLVRNLILSFTTLNKSYFERITLCVGSSRIDKIDGIEAINIPTITIKIIKKYLKLFLFSLKK